MKLSTLRRLTASLLAGGALAFGGAAQAAFVINGTDVGSLDTVLDGIASAQSGQAYEEAQLEIACGCSVTLLENVDSFTEVTDGTNHYIDVSPDTPGFYVLKFGTGNTGNDMFFMENEVFLQFLAWSDAQLIAEGLPANHVQSLSHYAITTTSTSGGGATGGAPEPHSTGILALMGLGLVLASFRARRRR
jgi:hypothetical protein